MLSVLSRIIRTYIASVIKGGERAIEIRLLALKLKLLQNARRVILYGVLALGSLVLLLSSLMTLFVDIFNQLDQLGQFDLGAVTYFSLAVVIVSLTGVIVSLSERAWMKAFGLRDQVAELAYQAPSPSMQTASSEEIDEEAIARAIEELVEKKVGEALAKATKAASRKQDQDRERRAEARVAKSDSVGQAKSKGFNSQVGEPPSRASV